MDASIPSADPSEIPQSINPALTPPQPDAAHRSGRLVKAAGVMVIATLASRVLGLLRETAVASWFGSSQYTDAYTASFSIPDLLFFLIAGGALSSSFIPVFTGYFKNGNEEEAWKFFSIITTFMLLVLSVVVIFGEIFARQLVPFIAPGFPPEQLEFTAHLTRIVLPAQLCFFIGGLMMATLYVRGYFLVPALGPVIYNLGIILGGYFLQKQIGVAGLCWGALVGAILGNFLLQLVFMVKIGVKYRPSLNLRHPGVIKAGKLVLPVLLGLSLPQVYSIVNRMFGSQLEHGTITNLDRANKLMQAPLGIFAQSISIAIFPAMSAFIAAGDTGQFRRTFLQGLRAMWFITLPLSLLMMVAAPDIVSVVLEYRKLSPENAHMTALAMIGYSTGLFAFSSQSILNRAFYAIQDTITPVVVGTATTVVFVALNFAFIRPFGFMGLALAGSLAAITHVLWMLWALRWKAGVALRPLLKPFLQFIVAGALAAAAAYLARLGTLYIGHRAAMPGKVTALLNLAAVGAVGGGCFLLLVWKLGCEELKFVRQIVLRKRKRGACI